MSHGDPKGERMGVSIGGTQESVGLPILVVAPANRLQKAEPWELILVGRQVMLIAPSAELGVANWD